MRALVAVNPGASRAEACWRELSAWFSAHAASTLITTRSPEELKAALKEHGGAADRIVIGGGDGTISAALPELLALGKPLAVIPLGTANDLARTLGLPQDPIAAAEIALSGQEHPIDIGSVNGRPFVNVASIGVAASTIETQSKALKRRWRVFSYVITLWRALREARPFYLTVEADGAPVWSGVVYQASVGNGRFHGGGLAVSENAAIDDGTFDLYLVAPGTAWQLFACLTHLKFGLPKPDLLKQARAKRVMLRTTKPRPINIDGELAGATPAQFELKPRALTVIVPRDFPAGAPGLAALPEGFGATS